MARTGALVATSVESAYRYEMANRGLNKVMLIGNIGKDAETRHTPSGTAVTEFSLATTRRSKDSQTGEWKDYTDWHNIVHWRGENVAPYLTKGTQVFVEGRLQTRSWEDQQGQKKYRTEVVTTELILLGGRSGGASSGGYDDEPVSAPRGQARSAGASSRDDMDQGISDDDVPF